VVENFLYRKEKKKRLFCLLWVFFLFTSVVVGESESCGRWAAGEPPASFWVPPLLRCLPVSHTPGLAVLFLTEDNPMGLLLGTER
jgi:hypothetical protein